MPCSTPLHHAASHGAPADVVQHLIQLGAWRSLRDTNGDTPLELAAQRGHRHLYELLTPLTHHHFPAADLAQLDHILHAVIVGRAHHLVRRARLRLPQLEPLTELESPQPQMWCPVPGMYGGFDIVLQTTTGHTELLVESWSRVNGGSGREHHVTTTGYRVISQGFV
ncbi:ankyrin repeat domain-containing protein [Nocardia sp. 2]|uniref:Ankyrin repeat domain-containing protein n=1 Tax=Nocardia acididurans TaxID=2802282 RepID=A0ABS1MHH9_9NOCA|nr:ankyrin repeat domain-containing protein [Nocardia acididurans]MBL1080118.1 ankyrin repeat domain-containing protein [Nocardia acididurans]